MKKIISIIKKYITNTKFEHKTFIVGGYVRDMIMNKQSKDLDIVVELPEGGIELANYLYSLSICTKPVIFQRFGTACIIINDIQVEFVNTRKEIYNKNSRKPVTTFGTIKDDVLRRDFTINSLLYDITNDKIIDYLNGLDDIKNKIIKTTSDPDLIFNEDPLRMLRAIRFASRYNFNIESETFKGIVNNVERMSIISKERIRDEFNKMIINKNFKKSLILLTNTSLIDFILPEINLIVNLQQPKQYHTKDVFGHTINVMEKIKPTLKHRLAALLHDLGKIQTFSINKEGEIHFYNHQAISKQIALKFLSEMKYDNDTIKEICTAVELHMLWGSKDINKKTIRRYYLNLGKDLFEFCIDLAVADRSSHKGMDNINYIKDLYNMVLEDEVCNKKIILPINGNDIMKRYDLKPCKKVGEILEMIKDIFLEKPELTKEDIFNEIDKQFKGSINGKF